MFPHRPWHRTASSTFPSSMVGGDPFRDFDVSCQPFKNDHPTQASARPQELKRIIRSNTVDRLKAVIAGFGSECGVALSKYGKKQELIDRVVDSLHNWKTAGNVEKFAKARGIVYQVRSTGRSVASLHVCACTTLINDLHLLSPETLQHFCT